MSGVTNVYLDVDGVLNAVTAADKPAWGWPDEPQRQTVNGFPIVWNPVLVRRVNALAARDDVAMHWLTTWEDDAARLLSPALSLNGSNWPIVGADVHYSHPVTILAGQGQRLRVNWWKLAAIDAHLPAGGRAVWIDDDLTFDAQAQEWLKTRHRVLGVSPSTHTGITPEQMALVEKWCTRDEVTAP